MKFDIVDNGSQGVDFKTPNGRYAITVFRSGETKDFDPEYWCRLIENAPEMLEFLNKIRGVKIGVLYGEPTDKLWPEIWKTVDYIKNGDETVKVKCEGKTVRISRKSAEALHLI